jgi:hypothetical protein
MNEQPVSAIEGGCTCSAVRYRLLDKPLFVHCCHCTWCQRETGAAFALNALIEQSRVQLLQGEIETIDTPSNSGRGQQIVRCKTCKVALWSHYGSDRELIHFIRVGTLDQPHGLAPNVHIYTSTRQAWLSLGDGIPAFESYYRRADLWAPESLHRYAEATGK